MLATVRPGTDADARQHPQALYLLRRAVRRNPMLARAYSTLARIRSAQRKFDEALQLYHFAACLEEKDEFLAQDYFFEARAQGKIDEAMEFLQKHSNASDPSRASRPAPITSLAYSRADTTMRSMSWNGR